MPVKKPLLAFDGDCGFCRRWIARWKLVTGDRVDYAPMDEHLRLRAKLSKEQAAASVWLIEPDGTVSGGARAVFKTLGGWKLWAYETAPGVAGASEAFYRLVAKNRVFFSRLTRWLWGSEIAPPTYYLSRWLFLRLLGLIFLAAFISIWVQLPGLIGHGGILPAGEFLAAVKTRLGPERYHLLPTLCWLDPSDAFLGRLCAAGTGLAVLLTLGVAPGPVLLLLWAAYLSLSVVGREFFGFQWDILLVETGFLAAWLSPARLRPGLFRETPPSPTALFLLRWLLFRLMFESGLVKLLSGDPTWRNLTALYYHYETQPLPTWVGWYAHQLPHWFQRASVASMFAIELAAPFFIWLPRRPRFLGLAALVFLQILILTTGNYCFFNFLTIALCLLLLDDATLGPLFPKFRPPQARLPLFRRLALAPVAAVILAVSGLQLFGVMEGRLGVGGPLSALYGFVEPFRTVSNYGLFAVMTTVRNEIVVEGSDDGKTWLEYEFKWKPGNLERRPAFVEPHQPRLDWQMWFAALGSYQENPWFINFLARLLEGSPEVLALMDRNPFPAAPPRYVRALVYEYHFTTLAERSAGKGWWKRELKGAYCPVLGKGT